MKTLFLTLFLCIVSFCWPVNDASAAVDSAAVAKAVERLDSFKSLRVVVALDSQQRAQAKRISALMAEMEKYNAQDQKDNRNNMRLFKIFKTLFGFLIPLGLAYWAIVFFKGVWGRVKGWRHRLKDVSRANLQANTQVDGSSGGCRFASPPSLRQQVYSRLGVFVHGHAIVARRYSDFGDQLKHSIIDADGREVAPPRLGINVDDREDITAILNEDAYLVKKPLPLGMYNYPTRKERYLVSAIGFDGSTVIGFKYHEISYIDDHELYLVRRFRKYAFFDKKGNRLTDFVFQHVYSYGKFLTVVRKGQYAIVDGNLNFLDPYQHPHRRDLSNFYSKYPQYKEVKETSYSSPGYIYEEIPDTPTADGVSVKEVDRGNVVRYKVVDKDGNNLLSCDFYRISAGDGGPWLAYSEMGTPCCYIDTKGCPIIPTGRGWEPLDPTTQMVE